MVIEGEREWERDKLGVWVQQKQTTIYKTDKKHGPAVEHRELLIQSVSCYKHNGKDYEISEKSLD